MASWARQDGTWGCVTTSGAGRLNGIGPIRTGGQIDETAWFAYGSAPGQDSVTIALDGSLHLVPVGEHGVWAFIAARPGRSGRDDPALAD